MHLKKLHTFIAIFFAVSMYAHSSCKETFYTFGGYHSLPNKQATVFPVLTIKDDKNDDELIIKEITTLNEQGIDNYIDLVLNGSALDKFQNSLFKFNIFDIAIAKKASWDKLELLISSGYQPSHWGLKVLFLSYSKSEVLLLIAKTNLDLNSIVFDEQYSTANFLLLKRKFDLLAKLNESGYLNVSSSFYKNTLLDISRLTLKELLKLSNYLDVERYKKDFEHQQLTLNREKLEKDRLLADFKHNRLVPLCVENYQNVVKNDVLFSYSASEIDNTLTRNKLSLSMPMNILIKKVSSPLLLDHISILKSHRYFSEHNIINVKNFSNLSTKRQTKNVYIDKKSRTLEEYLFLTNEISWDEDNPRMRLKSVANELNSTNTLSLKKHLKASVELKNAYHLGKNFSFYAVISIDDIQLLSWVLKTFGPPKSLYGVNIIDHLYMTSLYNESIYKKIKHIQKQYPELIPSVWVVNLLKEHSKAAQSKNKDRRLH